jgi:hypothetical protein
MAKYYEGCCGNCGNYFNYKNFVKNYQYITGEKPNVILLSPKYKNPQTCTSFIMLSYSFNNAVRAEHIEYFL